MISTTLNCIFVHVPKTGGSSIEDVLWPGPRTEADLWQGMVDQYHNRYQTGGLQHLTAAQIRQEVGEQRFMESYRFSLVRNPWDRAVSQYAYMLQKKYLRDFIGMKEDDGFSRYLSLIQERSHVQWIPQCDFLFDASGGCLVDFVGRFETIRSDATAVFEKLGVFCAELPHTRASVHRHYTEYYDQETKRAIERLYGADIERFSYKFGEPLSANPESALRASAD
jgi:hypothetical protein